MDEAKYGAGEPRAEDLILTRVLTLEGWSTGELGGTCDTLARYVYLHGTNHERLLGLPLRAVVCGWGMPR